nr:unnamed protein product [Spirometra erinaceieuropaei]
MEIELLAEFSNVSLSEADLWRFRQRDAWLPSEATRRSLLLLTSSSTASSSPPNENTPYSSAFTLPGLMAGEIGQGSGLGGGASLGANEHLGTGDPYRSLLVNCYSSEAKADSVRRIVTADDVPQDVNGLRQLLAGNWYRSALDLTHRLLTSCGHGLGKTGQPSARITPYSAQVRWLPCRRQLIKISFLVETLIKGSLHLWRRRECRILACCLNIYLSDHDYPSAIETAELMIEQLRPLNEHRPLYALLGRIYLRFGDLESAQRSFSRALDGLDPTDDYARAQKRTFEAEILIGQGKFDEAKKLFRGVLETNPTNVTAANNLAVCSLYLGQLEEAIGVLESLTTPTDPVCGRPILHDVIVANLAVLYEVESDGSAAKKLRLLERLAAVPGETVSVSSIKLG